MSASVDRTVRLAMWSGPRNMSTAMMRSFGARSDTVCADEPFYAAYLVLTGLDHPMREEILARHESDPAVVAHAVGERAMEKLDPSIAQPAIFYQKHMTHHMVDGISRDWMRNVHHAFLIRHPARVLASYARKMENVSLEAIGFPQQLELFRLAQNKGQFKPVLIDSDDILKAPEPSLQALCAALDIEYSAAMLTWAAGPKPEDGIWGKHWYDGVNISTGFGPAPGPLPQIPAGLQPILQEAMPIYEILKSASLKI